MSNSALSLKRESHLKIKEQHVERVLILFDDDRFYIGDFCICTHLLKSCRLLYNQALIEIIITNQKHFVRYRDLLTNNPAFDLISMNTLQGIDYLSYDVIICVTYWEKKLLDMMKEKHGPLAGEPGFGPAVFSISQYLLRPSEHQQICFPVNTSLYNLALTELLNHPRELPFLMEERAWGDQWLEANGMQPGEKLFVLLDSSSSRDKLLRVDVYIDLLRHLLKHDNARLLIFDEKNVGKDAFYREWLGEELLDRIIFSRGLTLRQDLCLLGSAYTKMVFGPCTGLLHCASGIYNYLLRKGLPQSEVPLLVVYTGKYIDGNAEACANDWWCDSPLVNCMILRERGGKKYIDFLNEIDESERKRNDDLLKCGEYTIELLTGSLDKKLH